MDSTEIGTAIDLGSLRTRYAQAAAWAGWSAEDRAEISAAIGAAVASGDAATIASWQAWLDELVGLDWMAARCRAAERRIRDAAARWELERKGAA